LRQIIITYGDTRIGIEEFLVKFAVKPAVVLMIYFGFFARQQGFLGLGGGMITALLSFALMLFCGYHFLFVEKKQNISQLATGISIFFIIIALTPFLSAFVFDGDPKAIFRFSFEVGVAFFLFFSFYYLVRAKIITPRFFIYSIAILGAFAAIQVIINLIGISQLRRLTIGLGSINYTANAFTICLVAWLAIIYKDYVFESVNKSRLFVYLFVSFIVFIIIFLSGTRSAAVAFIIGLAMFQLFGMKSKKVNMMIIFLLILTVLFIFYLSTRIDLTFFLDRFTYNQIMGMTMIRLNQYAMSITDLTFFELLIGRPDFYTFTDGGSNPRLINTHNFILSIIRYNGILSFILVIFLGLTIVITYLKNFSVRKYLPRIRLTEATIIVFLTIVFIYSMFSGGRITRMFSFYIIIGYSIGYLDLMKSYSYKKQNKKFVL